MSISRAQSVTKLFTVTREKEININVHGKINVSPHTIAVWLIKRETTHSTCVSFNFVILLLFYSKCNARIFMTQNFKRYRLQFLHNYHNANQPINYSVIHGKLIKIGGKLNNCFWWEIHAKEHKCNKNVRQFGWKYATWYFILRQNSVKISNDPHYGTVIPWNLRPYTCSIWITDSVLVKLSTFSLMEWKYSFCLHSIISLHLRTIPLTNDNDFISLNPEEKEKTRTL